MHRFVAQADVFLTNMRQQAIDKYNMDYATLAELKPDLIYCQGSGFGAHGPFRDSPGNEMMGLARSGFMLGSAHADGEPVYPTVGANDRLGSIGMAMGILAALVARERTGVGQHIHTSLLGWMLNLQAVGASIAANTGQDPRPTRREDANDPMYNFYRCRDGVWVALGMVIHKDKFWPQVCDALGHAELATDPRFATAELREQNSPELVKIFDELFGAIDYPEWERQATDNDFISTRVNALTDLAEDPQVKANGYITRLPHKDLGEFSYVATPLEFSKTPVSIRNCAPRIGENSVELLQGWLGMSEEDVEGLLERRIV